MGCAHIPPISPEICQPKSGNCPFWWPTRYNRSPVVAKGEFKYSFFPAMKGRDFTLSLRLWANNVFVMNRNNRRYKRRIATG